MSVAVTSYVWTSGKAEGAALLVLLALADYADEERWVAWPTIATLARKVRMSERTVQRHLRDLETKGVIRSKPQGSTTQRDVRYRPNLYQIQGRQSVTPPPDSGVTDGASRGDISRDPGVTLVTPKKQPSELQPSVEREKRSAKPLHPEADAVTREWWEAEDPRPATAFVPSRRVVSTFLDLGWAHDALLDALRAAPTCTVRAVEIELKRGRRPPRRSAEDESHDTIAERVRARDGRDERGSAPGPSAGELAERAGAGGAD